MLRALASAGHGRPPSLADGAVITATAALGMAHAATFVEAASNVRALIFKTCIVLSTVRVHSRCLHSPCQLPARWQLGCTTDSGEELAKQASLDGQRP